MIKKITQNIWKFDFPEFGSNVYLIMEKDKNILVDTSSKTNKNELVACLGKLNLKPENINIVLLTHWHFDHYGNIDLFENAEIFISEKEINDFNLQNKGFKKLGKQESGLKVIETPGHTRGSVCFLYKDILFSGDTLFDFGYGRTDLPTSSEKDMQKSLKKLSGIKYKTLCAGH